MKTRFLFSMDFLEVVKRRRSIRNFTDKTVPYELIEQMIDVATMAPSACNRQLWNFIVIDKKHLTSNPQIFSHINRINANYAIVVTYNKIYNSFFYSNIQSASAALMNLVLAATNLGVDSIWMAERDDEAKLRAFLKIPDTELMIATVCLGYKTDEKIFAPPRRPLSDVMHKNTFSRTQTLWPDSTNPLDWNNAQLSNCIDFCMRAKSPSKLFYLSNQAREYAKILKDFPVLTGETLILYDFSGELSTDLYKKNKIKKMTIHTLNTNIKNFIHERTLNEGINQNDITWLIGDPLLSKHTKKYDSIIIFKRLEKIPRPVQTFEKIVKTYSKSGTTIYLYLENRHNLEVYVRKLFLLQRKIMRSLLFYKPFQQVEPVSLFGPYKPLSGKITDELLKNPHIEIVEDYGLDLIPGIRANAGWPFWGKKVIPSTKFEEMITHNALLKKFFRTRVIVAKVK